MNLGQLIGELRMRAEAAEALAQAPRARRNLRGETSKKIVEVVLAAEHPLSAEEVMQRAAIPARKKHHAYVYLSQLAQSGYIARTGARKSYRYARAA